MCNVGIKGVPMSVAQTMSEAPDNLRRHGRHRVMLSAKIYSVHGECAAVLLDLSEGGAMLSASPPLPRGCRLALSRLGLEADGRVVWTEGNRFGVAFDEPLDERLVERLVSRSPIVAAH